MWDIWVRWLTEPFAAEVLTRALVAGVLAALLCAVVGTWIVLRGSAFLGEAMSHGMLPGVAVASLLGGSLLVGGLVAALAMAVGIAAVGRSARLSSDTSIGLLLVGMLALGVVIVSRSQSFAVDLTGFLFGDVLAIRPRDLVVLATALAATLVAVSIGHRAFVAAIFDPRKAVTLGMRPNLALPALTVLVAVAMVASFHIVGTLLVLGLLLAPPAAALAWSNSIPRIMVLSAAIGSLAVYLGLVVSWHAGTAGGATIAGIAVLMFLCSTLVTSLPRPTRRTAALGASACLIAGCASEVPRVDTPTAGHDEVVVDGAREVADPLTRLVLVDPDSGATAVYDAVDESESPVGSHGRVQGISGDGRFAYLRTDQQTTVIDAGAWTFDHGDHYHYFTADPGVAGVVGHATTAVASSNSTAALHASDGSVRLLDRERLGQHGVEPAAVLLSGPVDGAVPYGSRVVAVTGDGGIDVHGEGGATVVSGVCRNATWGRATRKAVVFGCDTGAVRITGGEGTLTATPIPFPPSVSSSPPVSMDHRDRADVFAGVADGAVWILDSRARTWTTIPVADVVAVNTAGDGSVLALLRDGSLRSYDVSSGALRAAIPLFPSAVPADGPQPVVEIDSDRAYVNNAADRAVYEIDYADGLRLARTLRTTVSPGLMVESGR